MSTPSEIALQFYKEGRLKRRREVAGKHQEGFYADGRPIEQGRTKVKAKKKEKEEFKNRHQDSSYKGLSAGYLNK